MRVIQTFILRLYTDPNMKESSCGDLRILPDHTNFPFKNNLELINLLQRLSNQKFQEVPMQISADKTNPANPDQPAD